jgi:hypothetical protein
MALREISPVHENIKKVKMAGLPKDSWEGIVISGICSLYP